MQTRRIGGLDVSVVALGCNNFGRTLDEGSTTAVVDAALAEGVTLIDTADNYGESRSEEHIGRALRGRRDEVLLATKFGQRLPGVEGSGGASPRWIRAALEASLRRLDTDRIDLYYLHLPDPATPIGVTLEALAALRAEGKVREIACSNLGAAQLEEAGEAARLLGAAGFACTQAEYSLLERGPEHDGVAAACERLGIGLLPYHPLASGMLTGKQSRDRPVGRLVMERYRRFLSERNFAVVDSLTRYAAGSGHSLVELAIGWLLAQPAVRSVVVGATSPEQVRANVAAARCALSAGDLSELDRLSSP
ncbi:MAG: aldo/keto reductase [Acidimicrobiales bacterium]